MLKSILQISTQTDMTIGLFLLCTLSSVLLGVAVSGIYMYRNSYTKGFAVTLALLPTIVQVVIMLVNGNLGAGVAVMGAFSLIRFRSVAGGSREIVSIFLAMAIGLATGMGYIGIAALCTAVVGAVSLLLQTLPFAEGSKAEKELKICIPESLDYEGIFDDIFAQYTQKNELIRIKTTGMGSLYELHYRILLRPGCSEKALLDDIRVRNGNLSVSCGRVSTLKEEL